MNSHENQICWQGFIHLCRKARTEEQLNELFELFFTLEEKNAFAIRYGIICEILHGARPQREIAKRLETSISKVTRGSNDLKNISLKLKQFLIKHIT